MKSDVTKGNKKTENYKKLHGKFQQIKNASEPVKRYIGGISKPNCKALNLSPNSSLLKTCPCESSFCKFAWMCQSFKKCLFHKK